MDKKLKIESVIKIQNIDDIQISNKKEKDLKLTINQNGLVEKQEEKETNEL